VTTSLPRTDLSLSLEEIERDVRTRLFGGITGQAWSVGAEVELIPLATDDGSSVSAVSTRPERSGTLDVLRALAQRHEWVERPTAYGIPSLVIPDAGTLSFEPGGQIELSTLPFESPSRLLATIRSTVALLQATAERAGITLLEIGLDPVNTVAAVPLQFPVRRYVRMAEYFARIGEDGELPGFS